MSGRTLRLAAPLLPAALLLHEAFYLLAPGGGGGAHGYLGVAVPLVAALGATLALAMVLIPLVAPAVQPRAESQPLMPFALGGGLITVFLIQELAEALLLGGGAASMLGVLAWGWLLLPLAIALGALSLLAIRCLDRAGALLVSIVRPRPVQSRRPRRGAPLRPRMRARRSLSPLAFGLARRPPPVALA